MWADELDRCKSPPFNTGKDALFIAYFATAELVCFRALGWCSPYWVLDFYTEVRNSTNGLHIPGFRFGSPRSLLDALTLFGCRKMSHEEKSDMRSLIMQDRASSSYSLEERKNVLAYCQSDVIALQALLQPLVEKLNKRCGDLERGLLRGRYMDAVAEMEWRGVPIDTDYLALLRNQWDNIKLKLIDKIDPQYGVFDGPTFKRDRFVDYLKRNSIPWPLTETGIPKLDTDTFRQMAKGYPEIEPLHELRYSLGQLKLNNLAVGSDGRNRCLLSPFGAKTGRHTPSNTRYIFGPARWIRSLIKPNRGRSVAYVDFKSQEIAIAAKLSGDQAMQQAYLSGDPYMQFAVQAGLAPKGATKSTHSAIRDRCKAAVLGIGYGMREHSLADRIGTPVIAARQLLAAHAETYRTFWKWSQSVIDHAVLNHSLETVFGWRVHIDSEANPRALQNYPMQANGAEMLRLALIMAMEEGLEICAPIHDAILIESDTETIERDVSRLQEIMWKAGDIVMGGFDIGSGVDRVDYPSRYGDRQREEKHLKGNSKKDMWEVVEALIFEQKRPPPFTYKPLSSMATHPYQYGRSPLP